MAQFAQVLEANLVWCVQEVDTCPEKPGLRYFFLLRQGNCTKQILSLFLICRSLKTHDFIQLTISAARLNFMVLLFCCRLLSFQLFSFIICHSARCTRSTELYADLVELFIPRATFCAVLSVGISAHITFIPFLAVAPHWTQWLNFNLSIFLGFLLFAARFTWSKPVMWVNLVR